VSNGEAKSLKTREGRGARCTARPWASARSAATRVVGHRIRSNDKGNDTTATDVWLSRATGMPVWHGMGSDGGGFRWFYGAAVAAPPADKLRK
jgi:hypothetical protein